MKKKSLLFILLFVVLFAIVGCGDKGNGSVDEEKPKSVREVEKLISDIEDVTVEDEEIINEIEQKYNELSDSKKKKVDNYDDFLSAKEKLAEEKEKAKINLVVKSIEDIGDVTLDKSELITTARKNYDSLTDEEKAKVSNYANLEAAESKIKELKNAEFTKSASKLDKEYDKVEGITWYFPKTLPEYIDTRCYLLPYIGVDSSKSWVVIRFNYTGDDWVFWKKVIIVVDGEKYTISPNYFDIEHDNEYGSVWETYDHTNTSATDLEMLAKIAKSNETIVRFEGDSNLKDYTIPAKDKEAIQNVLDAYNSLN